MSPKCLPFICLIFCNRTNVKKSQRFLFSMFKNLKGSPFTVFGIVRFFKRINFCLKIRFSQAQHAISDFRFLRPVFFLCDFFEIRFHRSPLNFYKKRNVLQAKRFRHYATYRRPTSKKFSENFEKNSSIFCFLKVFR